MAEQNKYPGDKLTEKEEISPKLIVISGNAIFLIFYLFMTVVLFGNGQLSNPVNFNHWLVITSIVLAFLFAEVVGYLIYQFLIVRHGK